MTETSTPTTTATRPPEAAGGITDQAAAVAATAADEAKSVGHEAAAEAKDLASGMRTQLRQQADEQAERVASMLGDLGGQLRAMAGAGQPGVVQDAVDQLASRAEGLGQQLGTGGLDRAMADARRLARNRPGTFLLGAAALGFVAARVARSVDATALKEAVSDPGSPTAAGGTATTSSTLDLTGGEALR